MELLRKVPVRGADLLKFLWTAQSYVNSHSKVDTHMRRRWIPIGFPSSISYLDTSGHAKSSFPGNEYTPVFYYIDWLVDFVCVCVQRSKENLWELVLCLYHVDHRDWTQGLKFSSKYLPQPSHRSYTLFIKIISLLTVFWSQIRITSLRLTIKQVSL